jgi:hypothetical protein
LTTVEFALIGALFFIVLFAVIEFGRLLFTWNTLEEATRRGARVAVVCPVGHPAAANAAVFGNGVSDQSPVLPGLSTTNVEVSYVWEDDAMLPEYVRVSIVNYRLPLLIPFLNLTLEAPAFTTSLPAESLGAVPGVGFQC